MKDQILKLHHFDGNTSMQKHQYAIYLVDVNHAGRFIDARLKNQIHANILNVEYLTSLFMSTLNVLTFNLDPFYCRQLIQIKNSTLYDRRKHYVGVIDINLKSTYSFH